MKVTDSPQLPIPQTQTSKGSAVESTSTSQKAKGTKAITPQPQAHGVHGPEVKISDEARLYKQASDIAHATPDIRAEKVAALKKAVQSGTYKVDTEKVADRLVDEHLNTDLGQNNL